MKNKIISLMVLALVLVAPAFAFDSDASLEQCRAYDRILRNKFIPPTSDMFDALTLQKIRKGMEMNAAMGDLAARERPLALLNEDTGVWTWVNDDQAARVFKTGYDCSKPWPKEDCPTFAAYLFRWQCYAFFKIHTSVLVSCRPYIYDRQNGTLSWLRSPWEDEAQPLYRLFSL